LFKEEAVKRLSLPEKLSEQSEMVAKRVGNKEMSLTEKRRELIEVWRPHDLNQLELRRGFSVARPVPRHWHEEYQFCFIQAGESELNYRGCNLPTPPASLFMVHPGEVHSNRVYDDNAGCSYRTLFVDSELMRRVPISILTAGRLRTRKRVRKSISVERAFTLDRDMLS
jgi:hypothetical protein